MGNQGECQDRITPERARPERKGFFGRAFRRMAPLVAGGAILLNSAAAGAFELSGIGRIDWNHAEKGSEYSTSWSREGGLKLNSDPKHPCYGEAKAIYFKSGKEAKLSSPNSIVTGQTVLQQSISIMRAGDTLSLAPMGFRMASIAHPGNDYIAHFDITDTGTGETSALDIRVGDKARFPWKGRLYIIETEGDNLLATPQTVYVRAFRAQENGENGYVALYPTLLDEGIEGSVSFGTKLGKLYGLIGAYARAFRRDSGLRLETPQSSVLSPIESRYIVLPGAIVMSSLGNVKLSAKADKEKQSGSIEVSGKRMNLSFEAAREAIKSGRIEWRDELATGKLDISVLKSTDGFVNLILGGGIARTRVSAGGTYADALNTITASRSTDIRWYPVIFGVDVGKGPFGARIEGAAGGRSRRVGGDFRLKFG